MFIAPSGGIVFQIFACWATYVSAAGACVVGARRAEAADVRAADQRGDLLEVPGHLEEEVAG